MTENSLPPGNTMRYDVFIVEDYTDRGGAEKANWIRVGAAFPHKDGKGFNAELRALPVSGKIVLRLREPKQDG